MIVMKNFLELRKNLNKSFKGFKAVTIAILGDSATQFIVKSLKGYGYEHKIEFNIYEADYDQLEALVFNGSSALYQFKPAYILILNSPYKLYNRFIKLSTQQKIFFANEYMQTPGAAMRRMDIYMPAKLDRFCNRTVAQID